MEEKNVFYPVWQRYLPIITVQMKNASKGAKEIRMTRYEFEIYGTQKASDYIVNLEIINGKVVNNRANTTISRNLFEVLNNSKTCQALFENKCYKISMGKEFVLQISVE